MKPTTQAKKLTERIRDTKRKIEQVTGIKAYFTISDSSIQAELRVGIHWGISYPVDSIHYPKNLAQDDNPLWQQMLETIAPLQKLQPMEHSAQYITKQINARTKKGAVERTDAKATFTIEQGRNFLAALKKCAGKRNLSRIHKEIVKIQTAQKKLLPQLREANSAYLAKRRAMKTKQAEENTKALASGKFWDADTEALKGYFHPPFDKNYLSDVSKEWRAALFLECESESYKTAYGNWGHKLTGTGRGYLCGIDDNGDEWGHDVNRLRQGYDDFMSPRLEGTVEEAMALLFDIEETKLKNCQRQGDLLFCSDAIPEETELFDEPESWEIRESHKVAAIGLQRNGRYFHAPNEITITHTSHHTITLQAGAYRLYELQVIDAD